jgi:hypothetical protein
MVVKGRPSSSERVHSPLAIKRAEAVRRDPGTRHDLAQAPPGASFSDGQRFVVLRATAALRAAHGKTVMVTRDPKGRLLVRPDPGKDIGS